MIDKSTRILVLAPHVDDELNCGGLVARVTAAGGHATVLACSPCYASVPPGFPAEQVLREFYASCGLLRAYNIVGDWPVRQFPEYRQDILDTFRRVGIDVRPTIVCCPSSTDSHQDHRVVHEEAVRAFRNCSLLIGWESPNNQRVSRVDTFAELEQGHIEDKVCAWKCYETQHHRTHHDEAFVRSLAIVRGRQCRCPSGLAEGYEHLSGCM